MPAAPYEVLYVGSFTDPSVIPTAVLLTETSYLAANPTVKHVQFDVKITNVGTGSGPGTITTFYVWLGLSFNRGLIK